MATVYVQEDGGGDYTTLAAAIDADETDIEIQETWSEIETADIYIDFITTITCTGAAKNPGYVGGSPSHFRIQQDGTGHTFTIAASGCTLDGLDIYQSGTGSSDEAIRFSNDGGTLTVKNCLIHGARAATEQDGIHAASISATFNIENCIIYRFTRAGLMGQCISTAGDTQTWNVNSCLLWDCQGSNYGSGISVAMQDADAIYNINVFNTAILDCHVTLGEYVSTDFDEYTNSGDNATANWDIHYCIDSDNSIASMDAGAVGCLASRTIAETDQGVGSYVIVNDLDSPYDLRLTDLGNAKNNAQDAHAVASGAGMNMPATDIVGTSRPQNTNYDIGAFEIVAAGAAWRQQIISIF